ncbi:hypothetical protein Clacol_002647 [Clathrus columnatus]|uniref:Uncharacterized protein n=1 Tax=Clathrus columnatus TaxID=1419009 RepID=A0AAV5A1A2_9AGAM|nr:hypothetical protein Clacol_002647 [Clathrus columnatus]
MLSRLLTFVAIVGVVQSSPLATSSDTQRFPSNHLSLAPLHVEATEPVENSYIVVLKDTVPDIAFAAHTNFVESIHAHAQFTSQGLSGITHVYNDIIKGYAGKFAPDTIDMIRARPEVDFVEIDKYVYANNITVQRDAPWGLARISHRERLTLGTFKSYVFDKEGGDGVDVYVIDTGINVIHNEFEDRAEWSRTMPENDVDEDANGHGTHCAGTIGSGKYGVAKKANLYAVKVLDSTGRGTTRDVIGGILWTAGEARKKALEAQQEFKKTGKTKHKGSVANMSLGGDKSVALDRAVDSAVAQGMHFAVAAGNDNKDACNYSPAAAKDAVTVGASTMSDTRAYFSNYGKCVDVFAPGLNILSTWIGSRRATNTISGTSMASPHVAGLIAYILSLAPEDKAVLYKEHGFSHLLTETVSQSSGFWGQLYSVARAVLPNVLSEWLPSEEYPSLQIPAISPLEMKRLLISLGTKGVLTDLPRDTPNVLVYNNATRP